MDTKEVPLSQNKREFFTKNETMNTNSDDVLLLQDNDCDVVVKTEIKSETPFTDFSSQSERECSIKHPTESETVTDRNFCEIYIKTEVEEQTQVSDFGSQNKREFLPELPVMKVREYNSDHETDMKIEIKEEPLWLETQPSSLCDDIKDEDFPPVISPRGKSPLPSAEHLGKDTSFYDGKELSESDITTMPTVDEHVRSGQSGICNEGREISSGALYLKPNNLIHKGKKPYRCETCYKTFPQLSSFKKHKIIHEGKRPHKCEICGKSFTQLSNLNRHNLIHEGKKPHTCEICNKRFTWLSDLKTHNLIHVGKKTHKCKVCDKSFTRLSDLKGHNLIHEGKKPYNCEICERSFSRLSHLKSHNLTRKHYTAIQM